ncbi:NTP transferase domain-containing protein [Candidatus Bathycorpusculum sp.]|uniref:NTP transferase domain-containing protein n=1 Tax=Candidatus Bathycorpusculum sp. TaxID=2994959 RepID=UPI002824FB24|nr:NTP transferase domain-containing protein [Candidatus Termitimicrobium sp.]MCL2431180.1 NTP transferase domain-containing protein [Candidatus Termitimicrobium sp.]
MGITALIMAGGRGTRMKLPMEKPLIEVCGRPVIEYVLTTLKDAKKINRIIVATTLATPKTTALMQQRNIEVIQTPGKDYVSDMGYTVQALKLGVFLAVAADLPLVTPNMIDTIVECYERCDKPALTVAVPMAAKVQLGMCVDYSFVEQGQELVPVGINVIDGSKRYGDEWLDQDICILNHQELTVNINTVQELQIAERLLSEQAKGHPE